MKSFHFLWALLLSLLGGTGALAQDHQPSPYVVADVFVIHSKVLGEDRKIFIYNPDNVGGNLLPAYPVLYLLEENDMPMVAGMVKYLSSYNEQLPAMLVVGMDGAGQRIRDLTPTHSLYDNMGKQDSDPQSWLQPSGGGDKFLRFVREEVMPFVEQRYRTAPFKILAGHSVGGLAAIHALATQPDLFDAYLAVSPSLWWDKGAYLDQTLERLPASPSGKEFLFVADSPEAGPFPIYMKRFLKVLDAGRARGFPWAHAYYPNETHGSIAAKAYYDGLRFLYPQWSVEDAEPTAESIGSITAKCRIDLAMTCSRRSGSSAAGAIACFAGGSSTMRSQSIASTPATSQQARPHTPSSATPICARATGCAPWQAIGERLSWRPRTRS